ncbi:hypothetical protein BGZ65_008707 [Modicella reniformis]|uniref:Uncharacterized protein n=1 Tax=Modicella reniformis TaxID=1440133 RepID=A0A9P6IIC3_9FUNG|nr:hypothetical protein BGZ65_008707 [Modicella reniformis]
MAKSFALLVVAAVATFSGVVAFKDNCNGSSFCNKNMAATCQGAINRFSDGTTYNDYVTRTNGNCVAIYLCIGVYPALTGAQLKGHFAPIHGAQGCKGCGSHAFNNGNCEVTVNFCANCLDSGNSN